MIDAFLQTLFFNGIWASVLTAALLLLAPFLAKRYRARSRYYALLPLLLAFLLPGRPQWPGAAPFRIPTPSWAVVETLEAQAPVQPSAFLANEGKADANVPVDSTSVQVNGAALNATPVLPAPAAEMHPETPPESAHTHVALEDASSQIRINPTTLLFAVWLSGALFFLIRMAWRQRSWYLRVARLSLPVGEDIAVACEEERAQMRLKRKVVLLQCSSLSSPVSQDLTVPRIWLPTRNYSAEELRLLLRHEMVHIARRDALYRLAMQVVVALHWYNPLVYALRRHLFNLCEQSCDEAVVESAPHWERAYAHVLLNSTVQFSPGLPLALVNDFAGSKREVRNRLVHLFSAKRKRMGRGMAACTVAATLALGLLSACTQTEKTPATPIPAASIPETEQRATEESLQNNPSLQQTEAFFANIEKARELYLQPTQDGLQLPASYAFPSHAVNWWDSLINPDVLAPLDSEQLIYAICAHPALDGWKSDPRSFTHFDMNWDMVVEQLLTSSNDTASADSNPIAVLFTRPDGANALWKIYEAQGQHMPLLGALLHRPELKDRFTESQEKQLEDLVLAPLTAAQRQAANENISVPEEILARLRDSYLQNSAKPLVDRYPLARHVSYPQRMTNAQIGGISVSIEGKEYPFPIPVGVLMEDVQKAESGLRFVSRDSTAYWLNGGNDLDQSTALEANTMVPAGVSFTVALLREDREPYGYDPSLEIYNPSDNAQPFASCIATNLTQQYKYSAEELQAMGGYSAGDYGDLAGVTVAPMPSESYTVVEVVFPGGIRPGAFAQNIFDAWGAPNSLSFTITQPKPSKYAGYSMYYSANSGLSASNAYSLLAPIDTQDMVSFISLWVDKEQYTPFLP